MAAAHRDGSPYQIRTNSVEEDGLLDRYTHLYITDRSVRCKTLETGIDRPVSVDHAAVETALFRHPDSDVALFINDTG